MRYYNKDVNIPMDELNRICSLLENSFAIHDIAGKKYKVSLKNPDVIIEVMEEK